MHNHQVFQLEISMPCQVRLKELAACQSSILLHSECVTELKRGYTVSFEGPIDHLSLLLRPSTLHIASNFSVCFKTIIFQNLQGAALYLEFIGFLDNHPCIVVIRRINVLSRVRFLLRNPLKYKIYCSPS